MLAWQTLDIREDPDDARYEGDPADLIDAASVLLDLLDRPAWHSEAACHGQLDVFFADRGEDITPASGICDACPVQLDCLAHALAEPERDGIWGGRRPRDLADLRRSADWLPD